MHLDWIVNNYRSDLAEINVKTNTNPSAFGISNERILPLAQMSIATLGYLHTSTISICWALLLLYFILFFLLQLLHVALLCTFWYFPFGISISMWMRIKRAHIDTRAHSTAHTSTRSLGCLNVCVCALSSSVFLKKKKCIWRINRVFMIYKIIS